MILIENDFLYEYALQRMLCPCFILMAL